MEFKKKALDYESNFDRLVDQQNTIQLKHNHEWYIFQEKKNDIYSKLEDNSLDEKLTRIMQRRHDLNSLGYLRDLLIPFPKIVNQIDKELIRMENYITDKIERLYQDQSLEDFTTTTR